MDFLTHALSDAKQRRMSHIIVQIPMYNLRLSWMWRNNPRARPSHLAHLSTTSQLKWSWGGPLFEIKALLAGFRSAGGIPTLVAFSALIRTLRISGVSIITVRGISSIIWSLSRTATGSGCTWAGVLPRIHVTWNIHPWHTPSHSWYIRLNYTDSF